MKNFLLGLVALFSSSISNAEPLQINQINETFYDLAYMFNHEQADPIYKLDF